MSLWDEAREVFVQRLREQGEHRVFIDQFLEDKATLEETRQSAVNLRNDSNRTYGINESRGKGISGKWILRLMENLDRFTKLGDVAMLAAPESVGLAWFAISQVLNAVQNNYKLYSTFNVALNDITEMMVLVQTYDKIYQDNIHMVEADASIYHDLSKAIREVYISILDFSYAVRKHITASKRSKLMHRMKDIVGELNQRFEEKTAAIQAQKTRLIQSSEAAFQQKTTDKLSDVSGGIQQTLRELYQFRQQVSDDRKEFLNELKVTKAPTYRDLAITEYKKNVKLLTSWLDASAATVAAHSEEHEKGTCSWIDEVPAYIAWRDSDASAMLYVTGEAGAGKSVLGAFVYKTLCGKVGEAAQNSIQYVSPDATSSDDGSDTLKKFENTLIHGIYKHALDDVEDDLLLQRCNRLFAHPKQLKGQDVSGRDKDTGRSARSQNTSGNHAPDLLEVYPSLVEALQKRVVLVIDAVDDLSEADQAKIAEHLSELRTVPSIHIRTLILCRSSSPIRTKMANENVSQILMGNHNEGDIKLVLGKGLQIMPCLSSTEKAEIEVAVLQKTGHRIRYVKQVAMPFLRTPFQRPVATWLKDLPENVNKTYHQHLHQLAPNYRHLFQAALAWTLVAQWPLLVEEIMEAYSRVYLDSGASYEQRLAGTQSNLYREQIQKAGGPFLDIRDDRVVLQDSQAVRSFFTPVPDASAPGVDDRSACANCRTALQANETLDISEKREHLAMAIICMKHLNSRSFQSRFFPQLLEEAKSRALKSIKLNDGTLEGKAGNDNTLDASSGIDPSGGSWGSNDRSGDEALQSQGTKEPQPEEPVDEDDSVFSDQDEEDFDQPVNDSVGYGDVEELPRYEISGWYYHVREAERLWPSSERKNSAEWQVLLDEMERFFLIEPVAFEAWKLAYVEFSYEPWKPLLFAAAFGLTSLAELLLERGADVMDHTGAGLSALHAASEAPNQLEMLRLFLSHGADPNSGGSSTPPFHYWLAHDADVECVQEFLRSKASCSMIDRDDQWNALHYVAQYGSDRRVLELLLDHPMDAKNRADVNVRDEVGETPLHKLLRRQKIPIALLEAFLTRGADVNIEDQASERPLYEAASWGDNTAIKAIIGHVTHVDDENEWGRTALHAAARAGQKETVRLLLDHGADANRRDKHNRTPLLFVCLGHMREISQDRSYRATAELLIEEQKGHGASFREINACTKRGRTPLREAAGRGFVQVVAAILQQMRPDDKEWINKQDELKGRAPLHSAATHGRAEVVALLLQHGADPSLRDGKNDTGMTSLELCLNRWATVGSQRYEPAVVHLIGACVDEAKENRLLLTTAAIHGSVQVLEKLAQIGVNLDMPDLYGWTPSQLASQYGHNAAAAFIRNSLASLAPRPTRWTLKGDSKTTVFKEDGLRVSYQGGLLELISISADHPVPARLSLYYYEIEMLEPETGEIQDIPTMVAERVPLLALGFCTSDAKLIRWPGWPPRLGCPNVHSWAYHADDGGFFASNREKWPLGFGKPYGPGDTIGCGLEVDAQRIFFTRNGVRIEDRTFEGIRGRVFPVLGLGDKLQLRTNFGVDPSKPFKWMPPTEGDSVRRDRAAKKNLGDDEKVK